jgi:hypothetical protein
VDIARGEMVEKELDQMIERRSRQKDPDEVRAYAVRREEEMRAAWCEHHQEQAARLKAVLEGLISRHEAEAERYLAKGA